MALRVVCADDNFLVREGAAALLAEVPEVELVETVADPLSLFKAVAGRAGTHGPGASDRPARRRKPGAGAR